MNSCCFKWFLLHSYISPSSHNHQSHHLWLWDLGLYFPCRFDLVQCLSTLENESIFHGLLRWDFFFWGPEEQAPEQCSWDLEVPPGASWHMKPVAQCKCLQLCIISQTPGVLYLLNGVCIYESIFAEWPHLPVNLVGIQPIFIANWTPSAKWPQRSQHRKSQQPN